ncbi:5-methylcytosine-specific restriction endonuclease system specificity protein McrC [Frigidibacter sp. ROC022]|uniref:5-methylcytosine-specific restriction endonuclease system specificity protein McrC n=1 Tax=Frigidibacter sp. ROC022 TaxID=2971796 RepID=UPI00215A6553|nr:5-methylcytosine-specific restriction endonuclease system specificity protein McrC [Frigidibacter sp. ROC022]MCR8726683.1 5-methylcytosine-specific restriction endonuclease system specificity protein McrC [Frigidibacter sp. ROC022]
MEALLTEQYDDDAVPLALDKIPLRNVWLLFLYASGLARFRDRFEAEVETSPDFKTLVARLLCYATEKRLRRNLSFGYRRKEETLRRVRGRIDILESVSRDLFRKGQVACRFEELTIDTPRNRLVRAALSSLSGWLDDADLAHRCRTLAHALGRAGVAGEKPSRAEIASDQIGRHEADDRLMVSLARAVFDLVLPTESAGARSLLKAQHDETEFRKLFEKAIGNFFAAELPREEGWRVFPGKQYNWPVAAASTGIAAYLPIMITDIILENAKQGRRIIIDTKFTEVLTKSQHGGSRFKTGHLYQLYAYLRSQERPDDPLSITSDGMLVYPSVGTDVDETALIQGHRLRFVTIDLSAPSGTVIERLQQLPLVSKLSQGTF